MYRRPTSAGRGWPGKAAHSSLAVLIGFLVGAPGPAPAAIAPVIAAPAVRIDRNVAYGPLAVQVGDVCRPAKAAKPRPGIILIHGGGWTGGSRADNNDYCTALAGFGFVVYNIDYRLANEADPATRWPAQLLDTQLAVRFLRANSQGLDMDPARMAAMGDSVGGTLALSLALRRKTLSGDVARLYADQSSTVMAAVDEFAPVDAAKLVDRVWDLSYLGLFGTKTPQPVMLQMMSPLPFMDNAGVSVLIVHGDADKLVPIQQSEMAARVLRVNDVKVQFITYHGGHGFLGTDSRAVQQVLTQVNRFLIETLHPVP